MKCPSCHTPLPAPLPQCPRCKLTLEQLDRKFGPVPRHSRYLTDRAGRLAPREIQQLRDLLRLFQRKFPQLLFPVMLVNLSPGVSISEYAFWLINRARFGGLDAVGSKNFELLLIVDSESETASLVTGYGLENFLPEKELEDALAAAGDSFRTGDLVAGIRDCVEFMMGRLRDLAVRLTKDKTSTEATTISTVVAEIQ